MDAQSFQVILKIDFAQEVLWKIENLIFTENSSTPISCDQIYQITKMDFGLILFTHVPKGPGFCLMLRQFLQKTNGNSISRQIILSFEKENVVSDFRLVGFLSFDVNLSEYDINQCNHDDVALDSTTVDEDEGRNQILGFSGTHKCHRETSQVGNAIHFKIQ